MISFSLEFKNVLITLHGVHFGQL